jgi:uncharacterized protein YndB with AHSA1/START domain/uncharacterized glyoxalase superfamily protein PhnB
MKNTGNLKLTVVGDREIVMTRVFDAPRSLVFDAMTKPELLKRWLFGPPGWSFAVCEVDLKVGGAYRYVWRGPDGTEMGMGGVHREIVPPERIVCTQLFDEDWTGGEAVGTMVLTERDGKTTLTNTVLYSSREARDAVLKTPMEHGMAMGYDRLAELLTSPVSNLVPSNCFRPSVTATLAVRNWARAVDFYKAAFGASELYSVDGGGVAQLSVSGAEFRVAEESPRNLNFSPESLGGCSVRMMLIVEDPASVCKQAVAAGATQVSPVGDAHGWRLGRIVDPFGHHWEVARQLT